MEQGLQKQQKNKGYRFFALALGMMCGRGLLNSATGREIAPHESVQKMLVQASLNSPSAEIEH